MIHIDLGANDLGKNCNSATILIDQFLISLSQNKSVK